MHVPLHGDFFPQCSCGRLCTHTDMWCMIWLNGSMTALWRATWEQGVHLSIWYSQTQMLCLTPRWCPINGCWKKKWLQFGEGRINLDMVVVQSLNRVQLLVTPWTTAHQASLTFTTSRSLFRFMSIESVMLSNHLFFCYPFSFCPQFLSAFRIRWPKYWSFSFSISPSNSGLISFRTDWFDPLEVQGTLKSLLQHQFFGSVSFMDIQNTDNSGGLFLKIQPEN